MRENASPTLTVENISCQRAGRDVFSNLSFCVQAGECWSLEGKNGAGKSSLLLLLAGVLLPTSGHIIWDNKRIEQGLHTQCHMIGHQEAIKNALTPLENLRFAQSILGNSALSPHHALERVGLAHTGHLPTSYLSAGQRRRIALARLLVSHRPLWLLDEPTSALDQAAQDILFEMMQKHLHANGMIVVATHTRLSLDGQKVLTLQKSTPSFTEDT
jgi:heme exporter protein A